MYIFIPPTHTEFTIKEDCLLSMDWYALNKQILKNLKVTDKIIVSSYRYKVDNVEKVYNTTTIPINPLFKNDDGTTIPIDIEFPAGTVFELLKYKFSYNLETNKKELSTVHGRVISSSSKYINKRSFELEITELNKIEIV